VKTALRTLLHAPGLTAVVVLSVALGIGVNTAIFSFLGATVLRPLPAVGADVLTLQVNQGTRLSGASWLEYRDVRERLASLAEVTAQGARSVYVENGARTERVWAELVSGNFFSALAVRPALGRFFLPEEAAAPGSAPVVVISHGFWQSRFAGSRDVLGQTVRLNNVPFTVIGVTPPRFQGGVMALMFDVWVPFTMSAQLLSDTGQFSDRAYRAYQLDAVLRPGVSRTQVQRELDLTARSLAADFPDANREITFHLLPIWRGTRSGEILMPVYATLQLFAALVLGVVCINTANLLLSRASVRRREIGIRLAVGAGPGRIIRQLLGESLLLALGGTALGVVAAIWGVDAINYLKMPTSVPIKIEPVFDSAALLFAVGLGAICGVLFGLAPALQLARLDVLPALRSGSGALAGRNRFRDLLVGAEVAVALVILILAGLFYRSFQNAQSANSGYDTHRVLLASLDLVGRGYNGERRDEFVRNVHARLIAHPEIEAAAIAYKPPLEMHGMPKAIVQIDGAKLESDSVARVIWSPTTPGYFATMGIPIVDGTDIAPLDQRNRPLDAVINETAARTYWPGRSPLGHTFTLMNKTFEVVGVARDAKYESLGEAPHPAVWPTLRMGVMSTPGFYVRARSGSPLALLPALRGIVRDIDADLALYDGRTLAQHIDNNLAIQRVSANFLSALAPVALVLAAIGLYAVLAYAVAQRTQEIGVRLTLGATPGGVVFHIVRQGMKVVAIGSAVGWCVALGLGWFLRFKLVGVPIGEPTIYVGIPVLLLIVATLACWLPARRAAEVDPIKALRAE
jgi:macrolide transport system ATP-binding/permease protein